MLAHCHPSNTVNLWLSDNYLLFNLILFNINNASSFSFNSLNINVYVKRHLVTWFVCIIPVNHLRSHIVRHCHSRSVPIRIEWRWTNSRCPNTVRLEIVSCAVAVEIKRIDLRPNWKHPVASTVRTPISLGTEVKAMAPIWNEWHRHQPTWPPSLAPHRHGTFAEMFPPRFVDVLGKPCGEKVKTEWLKIDFDNKNCGWKSLWLKWKKEGETT